MDRPVAALFAEFAGAVERIDDPDPILAQPLAGVRPLLGQDAVLRAGDCEGLKNEVIGDAITDLAQRLVTEKL